MTQLTNLTSLSVANTGITGDLSALTQLTNLKECQAKEMRITGDLSILPDKVAFFSTQKGQTTLSWKGRRIESANIVAFEDVRLGNDVDNMLINQAKCTAKPLGDSLWYNLITVSGNRTSASDSAVQSLKNKGYTVIVNGVTL